MWHHYSSSDRLSSHRSDARSPYAKNYRTNLTHDQREQLSHRQNISRLPRREFEDRYIALLDEYYALKKENAANNQKVKKMATKLLRLSAEGKSRGTPFPQQLAPNENLEIQIYRLEAYNSLLKDRLNAIIKKYSSCIHSTATSTMRRPASCSNLSIKRKIILSEDDLHLLELPEPPPVIINKNDNRSSISSGSAITSDPKASATKATNKSQQPSTYQQSQSSIICENDNPHEPSTSPNEKNCINNVKNIIHKLQCELNEAKLNNESLQRINITLEEKLTDQMVGNHAADNVELIELRRTMVECEIELHELRDQYLSIKSKAENDLNKEHKKIDELTQIVHKEMERNTSLSNDLHALRNATTAIESIKYTKNDEQNVDQLRAQTESKHDDSANVNMAEKCDESSKKDDLVDLLNEAKTTILQLQDESKTLKSEIDNLRQKNLENDKQIESLQKQTVAKSSNDIARETIPLEPIIIVKENKNKSLSDDEHFNNEYKAPNDISDKSSPSNQTSPSDNTFVLKKPNSQKQKRLTIKNMATNLHYSTTDSEISSLDSEENFRVFHHKNKKIQDSMMLFESNRPTSMSFSQRMSLLEKVAFYRPLTMVPSSKPNHQSNHRFLACDCNGFECDQQNEMFYEEIRRAVKNARSIMLQDIQNNPQIGYGLDNTSEFNKCFDDSSECREFLRVQYNLNNLYKQELELICKTCKKQRHDLLKQIDSLKAKLQNYEDKHKANDEVTLQTDNSALRMLYVDYDEGSFEFHINSFRPTKEGRPLLSCRHGELGSLYVSWTFYEFSFESKTSVRTPPNYAYDSSHIYVVPINKKFLQRLQSEKLMINLFASIGSKSTLMGAVDISLSEVLIFPQNKIQLTTKVMSITSECDHNEAFCACDPSLARPKHLGNLTLWFRLTCELEVLKLLFNNLDQWRSPQMDAKEHGEDTTHKQNAFDINADVKQSISNIDPAKSEKILVSLTIECIKFNEMFDIPENSMEEIHIEYSFLGNRRHKTDSKPMQTPKISFNFIQTISHTERNVQRLCNILKESENSIKFIVVKTKPIPEYETKCESTEIGFGLLHLGEFISEWNGINVQHTFEIPIISKQPPYQNIGHLEIIMEDIISLKDLQKN